MDERTGDGNALLLTAGDVTAFLADDRIQTFRHGGQITGKRTVPNRLLQLLFREVLAQRDILPDGGVEQEHILFDIAHLFLKFLRVDRADIRVIKEDMSGIVRQPAQQEFQQGGFSASGRPGQGILFAFFKPEGSVFQNGLFPIAEGKSFDRDGVCKFLKHALFFFLITHFYGKIFF